MVEWPFEEGNAAAQDDDGKPTNVYYNATIADYVDAKGFDLMIVLPLKGSGGNRVSAFRTHGYKTRRMAIDNGERKKRIFCLKIVHFFLALGIPLVTDIKCAKLYVAALKRQNCSRPETNSQYDCISSSKLRVSQKVFFSVF